jgi:acyl-CoA synthetase (NDP forming)/GNAT superfamily N-acetyltransferase
MQSDREDRLTLVDGRTVAVRATREDDAERIAELIGGLSPASRAMRFGGARGGLTPEEARAMATSGPRGFGLIALADGAAEHAVGLARIEREAAATEAELAVAVADAWQGLGLGTGLIERLLERAAAEGLDAVWAAMRPDNRAMRNVFRSLGIAARELPGPEGLVVRLPTGPDDAFEEEQAARFASSAAASLEPLFRPRGIAVVGASRNAAAPGGAALRALLASGFRGPVHAVNRAGGEIAGRRAYTSLAEVPDPVDLVVVAVPAAAVADVARQAGERGARGLVVISSGFAEAGPEGAAREAELLHVVRTGGLRMVGPNCLGIASTDPAAPFDATFGPAPPTPGRIAFASQSGGLGIGALAYCAARGLGLSAFVSLGNKADVSSNDLLSWWERDSRTRVILLYLEGFGNPRRFGRVARRVARTTPILALKAGRGSAGRRAAGSHTAALAAGEAPTDALFDLAGVVRVDTIEELLETGEVLASQPVPEGDRIGIVSNAGGPGILAADACEEYGLRVPSLPPDLRGELAARVPGLAGASNPVDLGAGAGPETVLAAGRTLAGSGAIDALLVIYTPTRGADAAGLAAAVQTLADGRLPVLGCMLGGEPVTAPTGAPWPVPWIGFPESAARALAGAARAGAARSRSADPAQPPTGVDRAAARRALESAEPGQWLSPAAVQRLLGAYGLATPRGEVVTDPEAAAAAQVALGAPVAVKLVSATVTHKADVGGVVLGCESPEAAAAAYRRIAASLDAAGLGGAMSGALVQEMVPDGVDLIAGAVADPVFGPVVLAGVGGGQAELWRDRAVALAPVGERAAADLWDRLRGAPLLDGWRGGPAADRRALADAVVRIGWLAAQQPLLGEVDCNPVRAALGGAAIVLDARARRAERSPG